MPSISNDELKSHYHRLIADNHPDKLIARGVPKEFITIATKKAAAINEAFDAIAKERGVALRRRTRGRSPPNKAVTSPLQAGTRKAPATRGVKPRDVSKQR